MLGPFHRQRYCPSWRLHPVIWLSLAESAWKVGAWVGFLAVVVVLARWALR